MSDPYRYTVECQIKEKLGKEWFECGFPAFGIDILGEYVCKEHANLCLIAGLYDRPLPEMDEGMKILMEAQANS